jgi:hypothetical protein
MNKNVRLADMNEGKSAEKAVQSGECGNPDYFLAKSWAATGVEYGAFL